MIILHHLNNSRSQRILWLLEELGVPYEVKRYQRDATTRLAPPELKAVHPLGKSPVVTDGANVVAESGAIVEYLIDTYGGGRFRPAEGTAAMVPYRHWLHFAEGSAMLPLMLALYTSRLGDAAAPLAPRIQSEIANHLAYLSDNLAKGPFLLGEDLTGADIQVSFVIEAAAASRLIAAYPNLERYAALIQARPAYQRALVVGGPYQLGR